MLTIGRDAIRSISPQKAQVFGTIFGQMRVPMALKYILPIGLLGVFSARGGWVQDKASEIEDATWGAGLSLDLWHSIATLKRAGIRLDYASVPNSPGLERQEHWTFSFWVRP